eukprot:TRINITY_DN28025_c0_g1_i1.p1 TRINITY_DN28025_c0_g1~~TRINITY_DN28025_c0_g1_i1.p1  ORF type:complete len:440 (-),score=107.13 TRINITY_DN28025_c0_g1_i1:39-1328(-)
MCSVFSWGRQRDGQCGRESKEELSFPNKLDNTTLTFKLAEAAGTRTLAISSEGQLYSWGTGHVGELGLAYQDYENFPTLIEKVPEEVRWKQIACGFQYSLALTEEGEVYSWGANFNGQLGLGHTKMVDRPTKIPGLQKITKIRAAHTHAMALDTFGDIFVWGSNFCFQLGKQQVANFATPEKLVVPGVTFRNIDCSDTAGAAITTKGELYTWGNGSNGKLGHGNVRNYDQPELVKELKDIPLLHISLGTHHTLALSETKQVYAWGAGLHGELGLGGRRRQLKPQLVPSKEKFSTVLAREEISFAISASGVLFSWGNGVGGLLGNGRKVGNVLVPTALSQNTIEFKSISASKKHVIALGTGAHKLPWDNWTSEDELVDPDASKVYPNPETENREPEAYLYNLYFPKEKEKKTPHHSEDKPEETNNEEQQQ